VVKHANQKGSKAHSKTKNYVFLFIQESNLYCSNILT